MPVVGGKIKTDTGFQLHWVNNKELQFTMESEKILQEMHKGSLYEEQAHHHDHHSYDSHSDTDSEPDDEDNHVFGKNIPYLFGYKTGFSPL